MADISGTQEPSINVINPQGQLASLPQSQFDQDAIDQGYRQAGPQDIEKYQNEQKYGTLQEKLKTAAEGALSAATFGSGTGLEVGMGVPLKNIRGRAETNPISRQVGEIGALAGQEFIPGLQEFGAQRILSKAGEAGAKLLGLGEAGLISKVGSSAVKAAIENSMFQSGEEVSKMFYGDPNQTAETAMLDIGLGGVLGAGIGGAFGAVSPLWKTTVGDKLENLLGAVKKKVNGESISPSSQLEDVINKSGLNPESIIKAGMSGNPYLENTFQTLRESQTSPGLTTKEAISNFHRQAADTALEALGRSENDIPKPGEINDFDAGVKLQKSLAESIKERFDPLTKSFEDIKNQFSQIPITPEVKSKIADDLANFATTNQFHISPSSPQMKTVNQAIQDLDNVKTLENLRGLGSTISQNTFDTLNTKGLNFTGGGISKIFRNVEDNLVEAAAGTKSPQMKEFVREARTKYKAAKDVLDNLNDRLHVGNYGGPGSFVKALGDMKPEVVLRRLSQKGDAGLIDLLQSHFPEVSESIKSHKVDKLLAYAGSKAKYDMPINTKELMSYLKDMTPQEREFYLPAGASEKLEAIKYMIDKVPERSNPSGSAGTISKLFSKIPSSVMAMAAMLMGHNPAIGFVLGKVGEWLGRDAPDAVRLGMLKFLGHDGPIDSKAFKAMVDYAHATIRGETTLNKAVKGVLKAGQEVLPQNRLPTEKETRKLDKRLQSLNEDPNSLFDTGGSAAYYLPDHATGLSSVASRATQYLNSIRPSQDKLGILDSPRELSSEEKSKYNKALMVAQQPLSVLKHIKDGTIEPSDVITLRSIYPNLYNRMSQKLFNQITEHVSNGGSIPYKSRIGLSLFLGQPLDSTMTPQAIQSNQLSAQPMSQQQTQHPKGSKQALNKLPNMFQTVDQARSLQRTTNRA